MNKLKDSQYWFFQYVRESLLKELYAKILPFISCPNSFSQVVIFVSSFDKTFEP